MTAFPRCIRFDTAPVSGLVEESITFRPVPKLLRSPGNLGLFGPDVKPFHPSSPELSVAILCGSCC